MDKHKNGRRMKKSDLRRLITITDKLWRLQRAEHDSQDKYDLEKAMKHLMFVLNRADHI